MNQLPKVTLADYKRDQVESPLSDMSNIRREVMARCREAANRQARDIIKGALKAKGLDIVTAMHRMSRTASANGDLIQLDGKPLVWIGHPVPVFKGLEIGFTMEHRLC